MSAEFVDSNAHLFEALVPMREVVVDDSCRLVEGRTVPRKNHREVGLGDQLTQPMQRIQVLDQCSVGVGHHCCSRPRTVSPVNNESSCGR